jgi:hypothetical protein
MTAARWLAGLACAAAVGCGDLVPDVGPLLAGVCNDADTNAAATVSFASQIRPVLSRPMAGCNCHMPTAAGPGPATVITGLDLSSMSSLRAGGNSSGSRIVIEMAPCASILYQKIDEAPPFGSRMPLGGPPFLSDDEIRLIHDWIAEGAADN